MRVEMGFIKVFKNWINALRMDMTPPYTILYSRIYSE